MNKRPNLTILSHKTGALCWEADANSAKLRNIFLIFKTPWIRIWSLWLKCRKEHVHWLVYFNIWRKSHFHLYLCPLLISSHSSSYQGGWRGQGRRSTTCPWKRKQYWYFRHREVGIRFRSKVFIYRTFKIIVTKEKKAENYEVSKKYTKQKYIKKQNHSSILPYLSFAFWTKQLRAINFK